MVSTGSVQALENVPPFHVSERGPDTMTAEAASPWLRYSNKQRVLFLGTLLLVGASNNMDRNILGVLLPQIKLEFALSDTQLGLLSGIVFALFYATLGLPLARWADRGHRPRILALSLTVWSGMTILCGFALSFWQLVAARIGVGAGEAGALPTAQSLIADYFPPEKRSGAMSLFVMSAAFGFAGGLILGGYIAQHYGWRSAFICVGVFSLLIGPVCLLTLKEPRSIRLQPSAQEPFIKAARALFASPAYRNILYSIVIHFFMGYGALVFIVSLFTRLYGLDVQSAGATFGIISVIGTIIGNLLGGFMANRLARKSLTNVPRMAGWAMIACVPVFEFALSRSTMQAMYIPLVLGITLQNVMSAPMFSSLYLVCERERSATALAIALLFANLIGLGLGPFLAGLISDTLTPLYGSAEALRSSIMILFVVMILGGICMLRAARYIQRAEKGGV